MFHNKCVTTKVIFIVFIGVVIGASCSKKSTDGTTTTTVSDDSSASGAVASSVGGALSNSNSTGAVAFYDESSKNFRNSIIQKKLWEVFRGSFAEAATTCPTILTSSGSECSISGAKVDLTYSSCTYGNGGATFNGTLELSASDSTSLSCGTFPSNLANNVYLQRQFVSAPGTPGTGTRTNKRGVTVNVDHQTANLGNFDNQTISANIGSGYGSQVQFDGAGKRKAVVIRQRLYVTGGFDHSVDGTLTVSADGTSRTVNGTVKVYHNKVKVVGTSTFTNLVYDKGSCIPVSGTLSTSFAAGANVATTIIGNQLVGKSESLEFIGSNQANYIQADGTTSTVELTHCY